MKLREKRCGGGGNNPYDTGNGCGAPFGKYHQVTCEHEVCARCLGKRRVTCACKSSKIARIPFGFEPGLHEWSWSEFVDKAGKCELCGDEGHVTLVNKEMKACICPSGRIIKLLEGRDD